MATRTPIVLLNVEALHRKHPATFRIHPRADRATIPVGGFAKLLFRNPNRSGPEAERMWVRVTGRNGGGRSKTRYTGTLANTPLYIDPLHEGDPVEFGPEHVADIQVHA